MSRGRRFRKGSMGSPEWSRTDLIKIKKQTHRNKSQIQQELQCKDDKNKDDMHRDGNAEDKHDNSDKDI